MVSLTHLVVSLFILVPPYGTSGYTLHRDIDKLSSSTEHPNVGVLNSKTVVNTAQPPTHNVPIDATPNRAVSLVKREVTADDEGKFNDMSYSYDPSLMVVSKRSAAALNKLMLALRSTLEEPASTSYENELDSSDKQDSGRYIKSGFRSGSGLNYEAFPSNALQRRGSKDRKVFLRCYFNAVSCF